MHPIALYFEYRLDLCDVQSPKHHLLLYGIVSSFSHLSCSHNERHTYCITLVYDLN